MASGFGAKGSEVYPLWQGFSKVRFRFRRHTLLSHRIIIVSLERGVSSSQRVSFCFLLLLLRGTPRARKRKATTRAVFALSRDDFSSSSFFATSFSGDSTTATTRWRRDSTRDDWTHAALLFNKNALHHHHQTTTTKTQVCRRRRTRRNAKTFERTT